MVLCPMGRGHRRTHRLGEGGVRIDAHEFVKSLVNPARGAGTLGLQGVQRDNVHHHRENIRSVPALYLHTAQLPLLAQYSIRYHADAVKNASSGCLRLGVGGQDGSGIRRKAPSQGRKPFEACQLVSERRRRRCPLRTDAGSGVSAETTQRAGPRRAGQRGAVALPHPRAIRIATTPEGEVRRHRQ